jgi:hypothetical protein
MRLNLYLLIKKKLVNLKLTMNNNINTNNAYSVPSPLANTWYKLAHRKYSNIIFLSLVLSLSVSLSLSTHTYTHTHTLVPEKCAKGKYKSQISNVTCHFPGFSGRHCWEFNSQKSIYTQDF